RLHFSHKRYRSLSQRFQIVNRATHTLILAQEFSEERHRAFISSLSEYLDRELAHRHLRMIARRPDQDRYRFILRPAPNCDHGLLLKLDISITIDRAC